MAYNIPVLELDITGNNINNKIIDEVHILSNKPIKSIAVNFGPFFGTGLIIKDGADILSRGLDYQVVELHQEATLKYGREIASVILILKSNVSPQVSVTYQALGGHYTYSDTAIKNIYESVITDNRPISWNNVFNKPTEYNPSIHRHLLDDVYGFEPVVDGLERIKRAITLGQTSIVIEIVETILGSFKCGELPKVIPNPKLIQYDSLLYFLSKRKILSNVTIDKIQCIWNKGDSAIIQIDTSGVTPGIQLYWEFYKPSGNVNLFSTKNGYITTNGGIVEFSVYINADNTMFDTPLYLGVKNVPSDIEYLAVSYKIDIADVISTDNSYGYLLNCMVDPNSDEMFVSNYAFNDELRLYYTLTNS